MANRPRSNYREDLLLEALARGASQQEAAMASGVSARTVRRRLESEDFVRQVKFARQAMLDRAIGATAAAAKPAIKTLLELLGSRSETSRLVAAKAILDHLPIKDFIKEQGPQPVAQTVTVEFSGLREEILEVEAAKSELRAAQEAAGVPITFEPLEELPQPQSETPQQ